MLIYSRNQKVLTLNNKEKDRQTDKPVMKISSL